jgi:hypothetical protein
MDSIRRNLPKAGTSAAAGGAMRLEPGGIIRNTIRAEA